MEDQLLSKIEIDDESEIFIRKAGRQYNVMAAIFILLSLAGLAIQLLRFAKYGMKDYDKWFHVFSYTVMPVIFIVYLVLSSFQVFFYYKAIKTQNRAIYGYDQQLFSKSFKYYVSGNAMSILSMTLYFFIDLIILYMETRLVAF